MIDTGLGAATPTSVMDALAKRASAAADMIEPQCLRRITDAATYGVGDTGGVTTIAPLAGQSSLTQTEYAGAERAFRTIEN